MIGITKRLPFVLLLALSIMLFACQPVVAPPAAATPVLVATATPPARSTVATVNQATEQQAMFHLLIRLVRRRAIDFAPGAHRPGAD